jgi:hypothetical protein
MPLNPAVGRKERKTVKYQFLLGSAVIRCCAECTATWRSCSFSHSLNKQRKDKSRGKHLGQMLYLETPGLEILKRDSFVSPGPQKWRTFLSLLLQIKYLQFKIWHPMFTPKIRTVKLGDAFENSCTLACYATLHRLKMCRRSLSADVATRHGNFKPKSSFQQWNKR